MTSHIRKCRAHVCGFGSFALRIINNSEVWLNIEYKKLTGLEYPNNVSKQSMYKRD